MANQVNIQVNALGNFSQIYTELGKLRASMLELQKIPMLGVTGAETAANLKTIQEQFEKTLLATRAFNIENVKMTDSLERQANLLQSGKLKISDYFKIWRDQAKGTKGLIDELSDQQARVAKSFVIPDLLKPGYAKVITNLNASIKDLGAESEKAAIKAKMLNTAYRDASTQIINMGKNTQWAGRQLTVGLTVPLAALGAAAGKAFLEVDKELTRMAKVYGDGLTVSSQQTIDAIRKQTTELAQELAKTYGMAAQTTAQTAADLAATGLQGQELLNATRETMRLTTLGELDQQEAIRATVALQRTFRLSSQELADSVNYLNAVENQTSTSLQDIVEALPRASVIVKELGGSYKDVAAMMVAMREAGVPAAEAANSIKSAMASIINPSNQAKESLKKFGIDIEGIVNKNAGNLMETILGVQAALDTLDPLTKTQMIEQLFGKFQFAKVTALIDNLGKAGSQSQKAFELALGSTSNLAKLADQELKQMTESVSGRFNRAIQTLRAEFLPIGEQIVKFGTRLLEIFAKVLDVVNNLGPFKNILAGIIGGIGVAGPLIMISGIFINLVGQIAKATNAFRMFKEGFKEGGFAGGANNMMNFFTVIDKSTLAAQHGMQKINSTTQSTVESFAKLTDQLGILGLQIDRLSGKRINLIEPETMRMYDDILHQRALEINPTYSPQSRQVGGVERPHMFAGSSLLEAYRTTSAGYGGLQEQERRMEAVKPGSFKEYMTKGLTTQFAFASKGAAAALQQEYGTEPVIYGPKSGLTKEELVARETQRLVEMHNKIVNNIQEYDQKTVAQLTNILGQTSMLGQQLSPEQAMKLQDIIGQVIFSEEQFINTQVEALVNMNGMLNASQGTLKQLNTELKAAFTAENATAQEKAMLVKQAWANFQQNLITELQNDAVMLENLATFRGFASKTLSSAKTIEQAALRAANLQALIAIEAQDAGAIYGKLLSGKISRDAGIIGQSLSYLGTTVPKTPGLAQGGHVTGPGGPTDDKIPAMLSNGEYVIKASSVNKYGVGTLNAMNEQRYANGGEIISDWVHKGSGSVRSNLSNYQQLWNMTNVPYGAGRSLNRATVLNPLMSKELDAKQQEMLLAAIKSGNFEDLFGKTLNFRGPQSWSRGGIWDSAIVPLYKFIINAQGRYSAFGGKSALEKAIARGVKIGPAGYSGAYFNMMSGKGTSGIDLPPLLGLEEAILNSPSGTISAVSSDIKSRLPIFHMQGFANGGAVNQNDLIHKISQLPQGNILLSQLHKAGILELLGNAVIAFPSNWNAAWSRKESIPTSDVAKWWASANPSKTWAFYEKAIPGFDSEAATKQMALLMQHPSLGSQLTENRMSLIARMAARRSNPSLASDIDNLYNTAGAYRLGVTGKNYDLFEQILNQYGFSVSSRESKKKSYGVSYGDESLGHFYPGGTRALSGAEFSYERVRAALSKMFGGFKNLGLAGTHIMPDFARKNLAFASGGNVFGAGGPTDDKIPAYLSNGEYVMNAKAVQKYGPGFMGAVNAGKFADGGLAGYRGARASGASHAEALAQSGLTTPEVRRLIQEEIAARKANIDSVKQNTSIFGKLKETAGGFGQRMGGMGGMMAAQGAVAALGFGASKVTNQTAQGAMGSAAMGLQMGMMAGPYGMAAGAIGGAIFGAINAEMKKSQKAADGLKASMSLASDSITNLGIKTKDWSSISLKAAADLKTTRDAYSQAVESYKNSQDEQTQKSLEYIKTLVDEKNTKEIAKIATLRYNSEIMAGVDAITARRDVSAFLTAGGLGNFDVNQITKGFLAKTTVEGFSENISNVALSGISSAITSGKYDYAPVGKEMFTAANTMSVKDFKDALDSLINSTDTFTQSAVFSEEGIKAFNEELKTNGSPQLASLNEKLLASGINSKNIYRASQLAAAGVFDTAEAYSYAAQNLDVLNLAEAKYLANQRATELLGKSAIYKKAQALDAAKSNPSSGPGIGSQIAKQKAEWRYQDTIKAKQDEIKAIQDEAEARNKVADAAEKERQQKQTLINLANQAKQAEASGNLLAMAAAQSAYNDELAKQKEEKDKQAKDEADQAKIDKIQKSIDKMQADKEKKDRAESIKAIKDQTKSMSSFVDTTTAAVDSLNNLKDSVLNLGSKGVGSLQGLINGITSDEGLMGALKKAGFSVKDIQTYITDLYNDKIFKEELDVIIKFRTNIDQIKLDGEKDTVRISGYANGKKISLKVLDPKKLADGGYISGPGGPTEDKIPAYLSNGEYVVRASSVAKYGPQFMDAINAGHFATGGLALTGNTTSVDHTLDGLDLYSLAGSPGLRTASQKIKMRKGVKLDSSTKQKIKEAEAVWGGVFNIVKGGYIPSDSYSGTTHTGGGVFDSYYGGGSKQHPKRALQALRDVGFAAWQRTNFGANNLHIHAVEIGNKNLSGSAKRQVKSFLNGGTGLAMGGMVGNISPRFNTSGIGSRLNVGNIDRGNSSLNSNSVYNISVSVDTNANPDEIANKIMRTIQRAQGSVGTARVTGSAR